MAITNKNKLSVASLDFDEIKINIKNFLKSQQQFQDYDFEGSSLSILIDMLAYNTHYNAYYANMIANEMFLDTATLRESVVSRAKMLGYTPTSRRCSEVFVDIIVKIKKDEELTYAPSTVTLDAYSKFTSAVGDSSYTFLTDESHILDRYSNADTDTAWAYIKRSVKLKEGKYLEYEYSVSTKSIWSNNEFVVDHYIIPSEKCDTATLIVNVQNSINDNTTTNFNLAGDIQTISGIEPVYWLHEVEGYKYELKFGDGRNVGRSIDDGNIIKIKYIATAGRDANGCRNFTPSTTNFSGWTESTPVADTITVTPTRYRVLYLDQDYATNFIVGETVAGKTSDASGIVVGWDADDKILRLVSSNGVYVLDETIVGLTSGSVGTISMSSIEESKSSNGSERETIESIRNFAPKIFQTQGRCVTKEDYETILNKYYLNIRSVKVWGGETMSPPQYGKVFISIRPHTGQFLTAYDKNYIETEILGNKKIVTVQTEIVDPEYIYAIPTINLKYNPKLIVGNDRVTDNVISTIKNFATVNLNDFATPLYGNMLVKELSDSDDSIVSVVMGLKLKKYFEPVFGVDSSEIIKFSNRLKTDIIGDYLVYTDIITSTLFTFNTIQNCSFSVDTNDITKLVVRNSLGDIVTGGEDVGIVDYANGTIEVKNFITTDTELTSERYSEYKGRIAFIVEPYDYDIFSKDNQIIDILSSDITVTKTDIRSLTK